MTAPGSLSKSAFVALWISDGGAILRLVKGTFVASMALTLAGVGLCAVGAGGTAFGLNCLGLFTGSIA